MTVPVPRAVVLLSGGLDSTTTLHQAKREGFAVHALSFDYGQSHRSELQAACAVAARAGVAEHAILAIDLAAIGGSALTDRSIEIPRDRPAKEIGHGIPATYVPGRNIIFLSLALAFAEVRGIRDVFIGANHLDSSGYPDCRPAFLRAFEAAANLGTRTGAEGGRFRILAPLLDLNKAGVVRLGIELGVDYSLTRSCYEPDAAGHACGRCDACQLRLRGFAEAGAVDPAPYVAGAPRPDRDAAAARR